MTQRPSIELVVSQHADEAAFLWLLRDRATRSPAYALKDLAALDARVEAHVDGLRVAGDDGWRLARAALGHSEPAEVFAASQLALASPEAGRWRAILEVVEAEPSCWRGLASALAWVPTESAVGVCRDLVVAKSPPVRAAALRALVKHAIDPGPSLEECLSSESPLLRCAALRSAGELRRASCEGAARQALKDEHPECRLLAARALALLARPAGSEQLFELALADVDLGERAADLAVRSAFLAGSDAAAIVDSLASRAGGERAAIAAAAALGDPARVPWLIERAEAAELARFAGGAVAEITGADFSLLDLDGSAPAEHLERPSDDPNDPDVAPDPDTDLVWPDVAALAAWWRQASRGFRARTRYLHGRPLDPSGLTHALVSARQPVRAHAAFELALAQGAGLPFDTEARGALQTRRLGAGRGLAR